MEHPCLSCKDPKFCKDSRRILAKKQNGTDPEPGPCEPFNQYVLTIRGKNKAAEAKPQSSQVVQDKVPTNVPN